jgi:hypothetical protein
VRTPSASGLSIADECVEAKEGRVDAVRVAALLQREAVSNGMPRYTAAVVV